MPRPGCVWTHSLILTRKDLGAIPSLDQLTKLFVRPKAIKPVSKISQSLGSYTSSIRFIPESAEIQPSPPESSATKQISALVNALYAAMRSNLLIACASPTDYEYAIMRIWSQQWPSLRSKFSFCTGALSARGFAGKPFNVQCCPPQLIREITTSALAKQSQEMHLLNRDELAPSESWIYSTITDAIITDGGQFRDALWSIADGCRLNDFKSFASLVIQFLSDKTLTLHELIALVASQFPEKSSAAALKQNLFGKERSPILSFNFSEWEILSELSVSEGYNAFDSAALNLRVRANELCRNSYEDAKQLISNLFRGPINVLGEEVLAGLLEAINPEIARKITSQQPHFLPTLFRAKPELGTSVELWRAAGDHVRELFESLASSNGLNDEHIAAVSEAILSSGAEFLIKRIVDKWGKPAVFGVLNYVLNSGSELSERVMGALTFHTESVMEWLCAKNDRTIFAKLVCAHVVAPYSYQIKDFGTEVWLKAYEELRQREDYREVNYLAALILALGLQNAPPIPIKVIGLCFEHIHQLAWTDKMPDANWVILDPIVPHLLWIHDWDKCERLRRGLIEAFVKFHWPRELLRDCIKNNQLFERVLQSAKRVDGGYSYFHNDH
jgi:hypothetical protein